MKQRPVTILEVRKIYNYRSTVSITLTRDFESECCSKFRSTDMELALLYKPDDIQRHYCEGAKDFILLQVKLKKKDFI